MAEQAIRVTLSTGKVVLLRVPLIKHQEQAMRLVGNQAENNPQLHQFLTGIELLKLLLVKLDDKDVDQKTLNLDTAFHQNEIAQLSNAMQQFMGKDSSFLPQVEAVSIGG